MSRPLAALGAILTAVALTLTACGSNTRQGPAGKVVAKDSDYECRGVGKKRSCHWEYELTTRDKQGDDHEFEVTSSVYDNCRRGSTYPGCIDR